MKPSRVGNFTSSDIGSLMEIGKREMTPEELSARPKTGKGSSAKLIEDIKVLPASALTYIEEKNMERRLGRVVSNESNARPLTWGSLCENQVFGLLGLDYKPVSKETLDHPEYDFWRGSPDALKEEKELTVAEIKCPSSLRSFCQFVDCDTIEKVRENHEDGDKYFWQCVSNAILTGAKFAELIIYAPYKWELDTIRDLIRHEEDSERYKWINWAEDSELPYLIEGKHYKNLNIICWEVAQSDKDLLTARVLQAASLLIPTS